MEVVGPFSLSPAGGLVETPGRGPPRVPHDNSCHLRDCKGCTVNTGVSGSVGASPEAIKEMMSPIRDAMTCVSTAVAEMAGHFKNVEEARRPVGEEMEGADG